jgi:uroporphyrinogen decarboxylase
MFKRPFMGGLERKGVLATGTEAEVKAEAAQVLATAPERFMLAADCTVPAETPWANLRAAIDARTNIGGSAGDRWQ